MFKYFYIHPLTLVFVLLAALGGHFKEFIILFIIIFIHEVGHFVMAYLLKWKVDKIYIYPFGGCSKFKNNLNRPIKEELLILIMGPLVQIMFCLLVIKYNLLDREIVNLCNYSLLVFNLLPIYPLDGGKLLELLFNKCLPYKFSSYLILGLSVINIFIGVYLSIKYRFILNLFFLIFLFIKVILEYNQISLCYNNFLLDRYLYKYNFKKDRFIGNKNNFYRDCGHYIYVKNKYISEKEFLKKIFENH